MWKIHGPGGRYLFFGYTKLNIDEKNFKTSFDLSILSSIVTFNKNDLLMTHGPINVCNRVHS